MMPQDQEPKDIANSLPRRLAVLAWAFLRLGCVSFGGPIAHLGYLRTEFVGRRCWLDDAQYSDLVALCQFLPGPTSSQVVFALGMHHAGVLGALLASVCFTLPSALLMIGFAYGVRRLETLSQAGWLHGLLLVAVAVVAQAVWGMGQSLCPDRGRRTLCVLCACVLLAFPSAYTQLAVIALGALLGLVLRIEPTATSSGLVGASSSGRHRWALLSVLVFAALLVILPLLALTLGSRLLEEGARFYRAGSLVFGGGHVVLPLLEEEVVPHWLGDSEFLAGYSVAQALPGPMFAFAAYLGAAMHEGTTRWLYGFWCLGAIYLPSWLLVGGLLPFWQTLRSKSWARSALSGASAAMVGILLAALYSPVFAVAVQQRSDLVVVFAAFALLSYWNVAAWLLVLLGAVTGQFLSYWLL